jgi:hypothetical protein
LNTSVSSDALEPGLALIVSSARAEKLVPEWLNVCGGEAAADVSHSTLQPISGILTRRTGTLQLGSRDALTSFNRFPWFLNHIPQNRKNPASLPPEHSIHKLHSPTVANSADKGTAGEKRMKKTGSFTKRFALLASLGVVLMSNSGCMLFGRLLTMAFTLASFYGTTPLIPVSPYYSELIEDAYIREERYDKVPILDSVEGEHAPIFCQDPPSADEVMRTLPQETSGGWVFLAETARNNVKIVTEPIVDRLDDCRFYPLAGPARLHHCHYKCTVYYDLIKRSDWPVPFRHVDESQQVVYIDHDHLIRCAGPDMGQ